MFRVFLVGARLAVSKRDWYYQCKFRCSTGLCYVAWLPQKVSKVGKTFTFKKDDQGAVYEVIEVWGKRHVSDLPDRKRGLGSVSCEEASR